MIREAAARILAGDSVRGICADLDRLGVLTSTGGTWKPSVLRRMLTSARICGWREHHGDMVAPAMWPPIVERETVDRIRQVLRDPARRTNGGGHRRYLLTGLVRCAACGAKMVARPTDIGTRRYVCAKGPGFPGCGKTYIQSETLETFIVEAVFRVTDSPAFAEARSARRAAAGEEPSEIEALETKLAELAEMWAAGEITRQEWMAARKPLEARHDAAKRRAARSARSAVLEAVSGPLSAEWPTMSDDRRRAFLGAVIDAIVIGPGVRGLNRFDPTRVDVAWRD